MVRDPQTGDLRPGTQQMQPPHKVLPWKFNQNEAWQDLLKQVDFGPRVPGTDAHKKCRDWILAELKKSCDEAHLQELTHHWSVNDQDVHMWNVIATQNWENAKQRVVLAAHWDSRPFATEEKDPVLARQPIPGANDGASGVAVLLELARVMKDRHPGIGVMYLMTDGEDLGPDINEMFLGAIYFSKHLPEKKPNYGILLDMIGDKDLQIPMERNSFFKAEKLERTFYRNANDIGLGSTFPVALGQFEIEDDHLSLNDAGIPTIDLIDFTYAPWHTLQDTPAHCSPQSLGKVGYALESWLLRNPPYLQS
jgi:Zn-dependent M28 family amino/carboxypeptidase